MLTFNRKSKARNWAINAGLASAFILPIAAVISCTGSTTVQNKITFDGRTFNSVQELSTYFQSVLDSNKTTTATQQYRITEGADKSTYTSYDALQQYVENKYLSTKKSYLPLRALRERDGSVLNNEQRQYVANQRLFDKVPVTNDPAALRTVYRGANGELLFDEKTAQQTYLQAHNGYVFDNMYFANISAVQDYLNNDYNFAKTGQKNYYLVDQQGNSSQELITTPGVAGAAPTINATNAISQTNMSAFVNAHAQTYVRQNRGESVKLSDYNAANVDESTLPVFKLNNTLGRTSYMVDINSEQQGSLFGPQVLTTAYSPLNRITRSESWERSTTVMNDLKGFADLRQLLFAQFVNMRLVAKDQVDTFSDLVFNDMRVLDSRYATWLENNPNFANANLSDDFFTSLKSFSQSEKYPFNFSNTVMTLRAGLNYVEDVLRKGQNYGFVNAISILRSWALNELINNGATTRDLTLINLAFDNALYYLNFLVHEGIDTLLSPAAQKFNIAEVFDFANSQTFGEDPAVYISRMESGRVNNRPIPEATEIILAAPFATLLVATASDIKKEREVIKNNVFLSASKTEPYALPTSLDAISDYVALKAERNKNWEIDSNASLALFEWISRSWKAFESADSNEGQQQALSTLRVDSSEFTHLKTQVNNYLKILSAYWRVIDPSEISSAKNDEGAPLNGFDWAGASEVDLTEHVRQLISTDENGDDVSTLDQFTKFVSSDSQLFQVISTFNDVSEALSAFDDARIEKAAQVGQVLARSFNGLRKFSNIASKAMVAFAVIDFAMQFIIGFIGQKEDLTFVYNHNRGEATYYWNGGSVVKHEIFGITWESKEQKIQNDDILLPIVIRTESTSDSYYYVSDFADQKARYHRYRSLGEVKRVYLEDLKRFAPDRQKVDTRFEYGITLTSNGQNKTFKAATLDALTRKISAEGADFLQSRNTLFGQSFNDGDPAARRELVQRFLDVIKANPIWVVQLPALINNVLTNVDYYLPADEKKPLYYYYAAREWAKTAQGAHAQSALLQQDALATQRASDQVRGISRDGLYLQYETEALKKQLEVSTVNVKNVIDLALTEFAKRFTVPRKIVLFSDIYDQEDTINYDNVPAIAAPGEEPLLTDVIVAKSPNGEESYFFDRGIALQFVLSKILFTRITLEVNTPVITYKNLSFESVNAAVNWVLAQAKNQDSAGEDEN